MAQAKVLSSVGCFIFSCIRRTDHGFHVESHVSQSRDWFKRTVELFRRVRLP